MISTIQRVFAVLRERSPIPEDDDPDIDDFQPEAPVTVEYSSEMPPETFDLVIVDEVPPLHLRPVARRDRVLRRARRWPHRYAHASRPSGSSSRTWSCEYTYAKSVADGVNVDFEVYRIETQITERGLDHRGWHRRSESSTDGPAAAVRGAGRGPRPTPRASWTAPSRASDRSASCLETFRDRLFTEIFPGRSVVPKTLIFAKDDNHAEEIVTTVREVFGRGNDFAAKITYNARDPKGTCFRRSATHPDLRIAVTVDMIATGTDVQAARVRVLHA